MKTFELVVTKTVTFRFSLPFLPNNETLLSHTKNEKICQKFSQKPNIQAVVPN